MRQIDPVSDPRRPASARQAQIRWWAPTMAIAAVALAGGIASLLASEPVAVSVGCFAITAVAGSGGLRARENYRRGWRHGYESAVRTMLEHSVGRTPDVEVRAAVQGDPTPEPWDQHQQLPVLRSRP